ncbi:MAG TPA: glycosyltransferase family 4 protein [Verrucomicrobiae bacterium]
MPPSSPNLRLATVIASLNAGGIGPVCRYAAAGIAQQTGWQVTVLSLHDPPSEFTDPTSGVRSVGLGLDANCSRLFLDWLSRNPQDVLVTSDVSNIEPAFPFLPPKTRHIIQIHDSGKRYRDVAVRHAAHVDGVTCVAQHIERKLSPELLRAGFQGILRTVHNGADFPPLKPRQHCDGPSRLLFMGRLDPLKGVSDLPILLAHLESLKIPSALTIAGGESETLSRQFKRKGVDHLVTWLGRVAHAQCYEIATDSDVLLMTSRKESFGMVTIEAMSMGCVPIAYDIPSGNLEIIEHGKNGFLMPPGNLRAWALQLQRLHADRILLARLSAAAIDRARTVFNMNVMAANMVAFITDVVAHAQNHPTRREIGMPMHSSGADANCARGYQRLPAALRARIRRLVGASPRLACWWLNR